MHDVIGSAGMLRGWLEIWTTQMLWLLATLVVSVGSAVAAEELLAARTWHLMSWGKKASTSD